MKTLKSVAESLGRSIVDSGGDVDDKLLLKIKHELKCFKASGDLLTVSGYLGSLAEILLLSQVINKICSRVSVGLHLF